MREAVLLAQKVGHGQLQLNAVFSVGRQLRAEHCAERLVCENGASYLDWGCHADAPFECLSA
jgi:hypothetical protein